MVRPTKDHVFPDSWYPTSTPVKVQRWTAPSCRSCNEHFGEMEKELFVRLALCVDPQKVGAMGLSKRAVRSFGVEAGGISSEERQHREALRDKILREIKPYTSAAQPHTLPGLGAHPGFPIDEMLQIEIPADKLQEVARKIVRGCEYWLANGRIIDPPYQVEIFFVNETPNDVLRVLASSGVNYLGPGCRIRRAGAVDGSGVAMYEIMVWTAWQFYAVIPYHPRCPRTSLEILAEPSLDVSRSSPFATATYCISCDGTSTPKCRVRLFFGKL
jgi:hypothetical protein